MAAERPRQRFLVTLESDGDPHAGRFLARLLKTCWRTYRLRCLDLKEQPAPPSPPQPYPRLWAPGHDLEDK